MNPLQDVFLLDCPTYEDYLDLYITRNDVRFIRNIRFSRLLVELGYRTTTAIYTPEEYETRKAAAYEAMYPTRKSLVLFHNGIKISDPVLHGLAEREKSNYQKILSTIIFLRHRQKSGTEISGYIDFEHSLRKSNVKTDDYTDWKAVFMMVKQLRPKPTDLSFYNSRTNKTYFNESDNYTISNDYKLGLVFIHKGDRKEIFINRNRNPSDSNATRVMIFSPVYGDVVLYDHMIRRKA